MERPRAEASFLPAAWASKFKPAASLLLIPRSECAQVMHRTGRRGRRAQNGHGETAENENEQQDVAEKEVRSHRASNGPMLVRTPVAPSPESPIHSMLFAHARSFVVCVQAENAHHEAFSQQFVAERAALQQSKSVLLERIAAVAAEAGGSPPAQRDSISSMPNALLLRLRDIIWDDDVESICNGGAAQRMKLLAQVAGDMVGMAPPFHPELAGQRMDDYLQKHYKPQLQALQKRFRGRLRYASSSGNMRRRWRVNARERISGVGGRAGA